MSTSPALNTHDGQPADVPQVSLLETVQAENNDLRAENTSLKNENVALKRRIAAFNAEAFARKETDPLAKPLLTEAKSHRRAIFSGGPQIPGRKTQPIHPRSPPAINDLDVFPDEVLEQILGHLHQPFHFHNYSTALLGVDAVPRSLCPWNPVGLQLVCRRWAALARPMFYRQLALDGRNLTALSRLSDLLKEPWTFMEANQQVQRMVKLVVICCPPTSPEDWQNFAKSVDDIMSEVKAEVVCPLGRFGFASMLHTDRRTLVCFGPPSEDRLDLVFRDIGYEDAVELRSAAKLRKLLSVVHDESATLRLPSLYIDRSLTFVLRYFDTLVYLTRFQLDLSFPLPPTLLDAIFPTLNSILQHPTLPTGREAILQHLGATKRIAFGTHSAADAKALQTRIDALGQFEVVVEVFVLDP